MMAEQLKASQCEQWNEMADVQTVRRRVEAAVKRDGHGDFFFQFRRVGAIGDKSAPFQFFQNAHARKAKSSPKNFPLLNCRRRRKESLNENLSLVISAPTIHLNFGLWTWGFGL